MRTCIYRFTTLLYMIRYMFNGNISIQGMVFNTDIEVKKNNTLTIGDKLSNSYIETKGNGNEVLIEGSAQHIRIIIIGNNNKVYLKQKSTIHNTEILIRANHAVVEVGERTNILGAHLVCQGHHNYINIGRDCLFSHGIEIWNSDTHTVTDLDGNIINRSRPITVGNHVWLGKNVTILKGVTLGDNSVVGMGSIVTKDIAPNTINVGIPSKAINSGVTWNDELIMLT